jgi:hypothetical protein
MIFRVWRVGLRSSLNLPVLRLTAKYGLQLWSDSRMFTVYIELKRRDISDKFDNHS